MLLPDSLFPSNPSLLERHPAQAIMSRFSGGGTTATIQVNTPFPEGDLSIVLGSLVASVTCQRGTGTEDIEMIEVNLIDRNTSAQIISLARRRANANPGAGGVRAEDEGRRTAFTFLASSTGRVSFNFPELRGLIVPNLYNLQVVSLMAVGGPQLLNHTVQVDLFAYAIPKGLLLR